MTVFGQSPDKAPISKEAVLYSAVSGLSPSLPSTTSNPGAVGSFSCLYGATQAPSQEEGLSKEDPCWLESQGTDKGSESSEPQFPKKMRIVMVIVSLECLAQLRKCFEN